MIVVAGLVFPTIRAVREMLYQFEQPFVIDATDTMATFGLAPMPMDDALAATVAWWRVRGAKAA